MATIESGFIPGMATIIVTFFLAIGIILACPETRGTEISEAGAGLSPPINPIFILRANHSH